MGLLDMIFFAFGVREVAKAGKAFNDGASLMREIAAAKGGVETDDTPFVMPTTSDWTHSVALLARAIKDDKLSTSGEGESLVIRYYIWDDNPRQSGYKVFKNKDGGVRCEFKSNYWQFAGDTQTLLADAKAVAAKI